MKEETIYVEFLFRAAPVYYKLWTKKKKIPDTCTIYVLDDVLNVTHCVEKCKGNITTLGGVLINVFVDPPRLAAA